MANPAHAAAPPMVISSSDFNSRDADTAAISLSRYFITVSSLLVLFIDTRQFIGNRSNKFGSIFQRGIITSCTVHHFLALLGVKMTSLVMLQNSQFRVDLVVFSRRVVDESPAIMMVHIDTGCRVNNGLY